MHRFYTLYAFGARAAPAPGSSKTFRIGVADRATWIVPIRVECHPVVGVWMRRGPLRTLFH